MYRNLKLDEKSFLEYYVEEMWNSNHVKLLDPRNTWCGPQPECTVLRKNERPWTPGNFWQMYLPDNILEKIVVQTNLYARTELVPRHKKALDPIRRVREDDNVDIEGLSDDGLFECNDFYTVQLSNNFDTGPSTYPPPAV
jgi:hypothetical protein